MSRQYLNCGFKLEKLSGRRLLLNYSDRLQNGDSKSYEKSRDETKNTDRPYCNDFIIILENPPILNELFSEFKVKAPSKTPIFKIRLSNCTFQSNCNFVLFDFFDIDRQMCSSYQKI